MYQNTLPNLISLMCEPYIFADAPQFSALLDGPAVYEKPFALSNEAQLCFDGSAGGSVEISATRPAVGLPFLSVTPRKMGANSWLSLEIDLALDTLDKVTQIIPTLVAGAARSVSIFALVRFTMSDEKTYETSSTQLELRRGSCTNSFPISVADLPVGTLENAASAQLLFFFEARDVIVDFYSLSVMGITQARTDFSPALLAQLRERAQETEIDLHHVNFDSSVFQADDVITHHKSLGQSCYLDLEPRENSCILMSPREGSVLLDFTAARECKWRTFEMRFNHVKDTGSLNAIVSYEGTARGRGEFEHISLMFRLYHPDGGGFEDKGFVATLSIGRLTSTRQAEVDISALLPDTHTHHNFGLLCFIPESCKTLTIKKLETLLYDKRL